MRRAVIILACAVAVTGCKKKEPAEQAPPAAGITPAAEQVQMQAKRGAEVFQQKCVVCHKVAGSGGSMASDLTKVGTRHDAVYLQTLLQDPKIYKADTRMPSFKDMPKEDMDALISYLLTLK